ARGNRGVKLAKRACGSVARVCEKGLASFASLIVERFEMLFFYKNFAPDGKFCRERSSSVRKKSPWYCANRFNIQRNIFACKPVSPSACAGKRAIFIHEFNGEPVHFEFGNVVDLAAMPQ